VCTGSKTIVIIKKKEKKSIQECSQSITATNFTKKSSLDRLIKQLGVCNSPAVSLSDKLSLLFVHVDMGVC